MLLKLEKIISCTSEHPLYPASNLLQQRMNSSWRCAKPGELMASVIIKVAEPSCITSLDIANYRSCIVVVEASTSAQPDNWLPVVNHQFMTHDEAINGNFRDQVQLFTKKELNSETLRTKFDRIKITCMQSANLREIFGLAFLVLRTEVVLELKGDVLGRFKLKTEDNTVENFKNKCMKFLPGKGTTYKESLVDKIKETAASNFAKRQEEPKETRRRSFLDKNENDKEKASRETRAKSEEKPLACVEKKKEETPSSSAKVSAPVRRTPFGDVIKKDTEKTTSIFVKKRALYYDDSSEDEENAKSDKANCSTCAEQGQDELCKNCKRLPPPRPDDTPPAKKPKVQKPKKPRKPEKPKKPFSKLFEDVSFSLSGYVNPQRDEIRRKALKMGGRYVVDPNTTNNKCTHLICAFKSTPKSQQLKGHTKIVSHKFVDECFDKKKRLPWRRFSLEKADKLKPESEEEIEGSMSPVRPPNPYEQDTDSDSNY